jgi:adenylate cyclase
VDKQRTQRRLAAILAADVVGYSRLIEGDEEGTRARLRNLQAEIIEPKVAADGGRIVKTTGDGFLIEFASAVDAVRNALAIQGALQRRNADIPENSRIALRIGINVGDVLVEGDDIHGDGVNVAARLEGLCEPGAVYVSGTVYDQTAGKLAASYADLGEQTVKNIVKPVRVYRAESGYASGGNATSAPASPAAAEPAPQADPDNDSNLPSIVVLPFANMSGDPEQEYFVDGLTEDILTELSRFHDLLVISRTSSFAYKNKEMKVSDIAKELDVRYVLEGSVRKAGNRVRVTVQLIEAEADRHVWADRYDRQLEDIFDIQDELTTAIAAVLPRRIEADRTERAKRKTPDNMAAYELVLAGKVLHHRSQRAANEEATQLLQRAIDLDPGYAHAHAWKACVLGQAWGYEWCESREETADVIVKELETALALDENDSDVHRVLAAVGLLFNDFDKAEHHQAIALRLNPNDDLIVVQNGEVLTWVGRAEEGIEWIKKAMRINPFHPPRFWGHLGRAHFTARHYDEAIKAYNQLSVQDAASRAFQAASHAYLGNDAGAAKHRDALLNTQPAFTIAGLIDTMHYKHEADRDHLRDGMIKAGLPT